MKSIAYRKQLNANVNKHTVLRNHSYTKMVQQLTDLVSDLARKYKTIGNYDGLNVKVIFNEHLIHRMVDRGVDKTIISKFVTSIIRDKTCEIIYLSTLYTGRSIHLFYKGFMCIIDGRITPNGNYLIKIRTVFEPSLNREPTNRDIILDKVEICESLN